MAKLTIGIDLNGKEIVSAIPDSTAFNETKTVLTGTLGGIITETVSDGAVTVTYGTDTASGTLYSKPAGGTGTNYTLTLPDDFGTVNYVNDEAVSFVYLSRTAHVKLYVLSEDMAIIDLDDMLSGYLEGYVPSSRQVAGKALSADITVAELRTALSAYYQGGTDVGIADGGTGASTAADALTNLGAAAASHTHDDRYYTESETNTLLSGKAASSHTHDDRYYTESETDTLLNGKAASSHTHDDRYYTESEVNNLLNGKAASSHTHDDRYYTESEVDTKLNGKAPAFSAGNTILSSYQYGNTLPAAGNAGRIFFKKV